jgi:hypothetical protein
MTDLFQVDDPTGKSVVCSVETWEQHVLANRPWMAGWEDRVRKTIENPTYGIYEDAAHPKRRIYYSMHSSKTRYLKVVVQFDAASGILITAFPTNDMKAGEYLIWPTSNV